MKKTLLTMALALILGLGANAQTMFDWDEWDYDSESSGMFDWESSTDFELNNLGMFDWNVFTDLLDFTSQVDGISDWISEFELFGDRGGVITPGLPGHDLSTNQDAPLGSGLVVLVGLGAAYAFAKRRKEE